MHERKNRTVKESDIKSAESNQNHFRTEICEYPYKKRRKSAIIQNIGRPMMEIGIIIAECGAKYKRKMKKNYGTLMIKYFYFLKIR